MIRIDDAEYKQLYQECFTRFLTRDRPSRDPIEFGCRISAFLYVLFCFLWDKDRTVSDRSWEGKRLNRTLFFERIYAIINLEEISIRNELLNTIFVENQVAGDCAVLTTSHVDALEEYEGGTKILVSMEEFSSLFSTFSFAIFGIAFKDLEGLAGTIIHYFVIRKEEERYVMISSYGSNYADIAQYETPLDLEDFTRYVQQLSIRERDMKFVTDFMKKYFLNKAHGITIKTETGKNEEGYPLYEQKPPCHYAEDICLYEKNSDATIDAELSSFYGNLGHDYYLFEVVCFNQALDTLSTLTKLTGGMRKRKTRKGKRTHYVRSRRVYRRTLHKK